MPRTITTKLFTYISPYNRITPESLAGDDIAHLLVYTHADMTSSGYTLLGTASVTVVIDEDEILVRQLDSLKNQIELVRDTAAKKIGELEDTLRNLQALTYEAA